MKSLLRAKRTWPSLNGYKLSGGKNVYLIKQDDEELIRKSTFIQIRKKIVKYQIENFWGNLIALIG